MGLGWARKVFAAAPAMDPMDLRAQRAAYREILAEPAMKAAGELGKGMAGRVGAWLRDMEREIYRAETLNVTDALHEASPDWISFSPRHDDAEEALASSPIVRGVAQEDWIRETINYLGDQIQAKAILAALRMRGNWQSTALSLAAEVEKSFDTYGKSLARFAKGGGIWAANVAKAAILEDLSNGSVDERNHRGAVA